MNADQFVAMLVHQDDIELIKSVYRNENTVTEFVTRQQETLEAYEVAISNMELYSDKIADITRMIDDEVFTAYQSDCLRTEGLKRGE